MARLAQDRGYAGRPGLSRGTLLDAILARISAEHFQMVSAGGSDDRPGQGECRDQAILEQAGTRRSVRRLRRRFDRLDLESTVLGRSSGGTNERPAVLRRLCRELQGTERLRSSNRRLPTSRTSSPRRQRTSKSAPATTAASSRPLRPTFTASSTIGSSSFRPPPEPDRTICSKAAAAISTPAASTPTASNCWQASHLFLALASTDPTPTSMPPTAAQGMRRSTKTRA